MASRFKFKEQNREQLHKEAQLVKAQSFIDSVQFSKEEQADINLSKVCRSMK